MSLFPCFKKKKKSGFNAPVGWKDHLIASDTNARNIVYDVEERRPKSKRPNLKFLKGRRDSRFDGYVFVAAYNVPPNMTDNGAYYMPADNTIYLAGSEHGAPPEPGTKDFRIARNYLTHEALHPYVVTHDPRYKGKVPHWRDS